MPSNGSTRRDALKLVGTAAGASSLSGVAAAAPGEGDGVEKVVVNIGWANERGRSKAKDASGEEVREFQFDAMTKRMPKPAIEGLQNNPNIRYVEENGTMEALAQSTPWGIDRTDSEVAHANGDTGSGADIAIIDTGIDGDHPDLEANVGAGKAFAVCGSGGTFGGCYFSGNSNSCNQDWSDDNDHGTHCAGTANAVNNGQGVVGVSTEATLHGVKVLDCAGSGSFSDIAAGVEYVADQGWDVASMSLGGSSSSQALKDAVSYAAGKGVFLVAAAGNSGSCTDCVGYPAAYGEVMAVSATSSDDSLASFSSTGPEVEIAAPGENVNSTVAGGYGQKSGTSMACPHVAGAAGQLAAQGLSRTEIRSSLKSSAEDIGLGANESGSGLLDVAAALGYDSSDN